MAEERRVLILAGSAEAVELARRTAAMAGVAPIASLAGATRAPAKLAGELRVGGFGGAEGLRAFIAERRVAAVIDATHPFATTISANAVQACAAAGVARLRLDRPPWSTRQGDRWIAVADARAAAAALPGLGRRIFLAIGRQGLAAVATLGDLHLLVRVIDPPPTPPPANVAFVVGRGPFDVAHERRLFATHRIDAVVSKNAGGPASYPKIAAAHAAGLPVVMIERPPPPPGPRVATVAEALAWLAARVG